MVAGVLENKRMESLIESDLIYWDKKAGRWVAYEKIYYDTDMIKVIKERSILYDIATTADASKELTEIFGKKDVFENAKPVELIKFLFNIQQMHSRLYSILSPVSGTTMHAVLNLNKEDGGNRKCIMVQMTEATEQRAEEEHLQRHYARAREAGN